MATSKNEMHPDINKKVTLELQTIHTLDWHVHKSTSYSMIIHLNGPTLIPREA